jgi:hypothetical protein
MNSESEVPKGIFSEVDRLIGEKNADAAGLELQKAQKEIQELFSLPAMMRWIEIDSLRGDWSKVIAACEQVTKLALLSPHRGRLVTLHAEALRHTGKEMEAGILVEEAAKALCDHAMKLGETGAFNHAKELLLAAMALHPAIELFAEANPRCGQILHRPENN